LALLLPERLHPAQQRSFATLWRTAQIEQQLCPVPFQWRGTELTPVELLAAFPRSA
jgi:2-amino-4-hydroxy-6-hydroxymethyldihydropteridine diphosphokinase